jgi:hypothetical protein
LKKRIEKLMEKIKSFLFPILGGSTGSIIKGSELMNVSIGGILDCIVYAFIGAVVGYGTKLLFDYIKKRMNK